MGNFKASFQGFNGHEGEEPVDNSDGPLILEFDTHAERAAFLQGVNMTSEVMHGWLESAVETKIIETKIIENKVEPSPYSPEDLLAATAFLHSMKGMTVDDMQPMIDDYVKDVGITTPRSYSKFSVLTAMARELRAKPGMSTVLDALKTHLMENM